MNDYLLNFIAISLSEIARIKLFSNISSVKSELNFRNIVIFISTLVLYNTLSLYLSGIVKLLLLYLFSLILYKSLFKIKLKEIVFYLALIYILSELIILPIEFLIKMYPFTSFNIIIYSKYFKIYKIFLHTLIYLLYSNKKDFIGTSELFYMYLTENKIFCKNVILILVSFLIFHVIIDSFPIKVSMIVYTLYLVICIIILIKIALHYACKININYVDISTFNKLKEKYVEENTEFRNMRHNLLNDLLAVKTSNYDDNVIDSLINKYKKDYQLNECISTTKFGIDGLIDIKIKNAKKVGVKIIYDESANKITRLYKNVDYLKLCEAIGIIIDNAIEACMDMKEKTVYIDIENSNEFHMKIINRFDNPIDIDKMFVTNYSTKKRSSGLGLNYLYSLEQYGIHTSVNIIDTTFIVNLDV